jgi:lipopolysaccharide transport system ATP-binding protein
MEFDVIKPGYRLLPIHHFCNEDGLLIFEAHDTDPAWCRRGWSVGSYTSTAWIPGNLLTEGMLFVHSAVITISPDIKQFFERDVVAFQVVEGSDGNSARGDWAGAMKGVVRPLLQWRTRFTPAATNGTDSALSSVS